MVSVNSSQKVDSRPLIVGWLVVVIDRQLALFTCVMLSRNDFTVMTALRTSFLVKYLSAVVCSELKMFIKPPLATARAA